MMKEEKEGYKIYKYLKHKKRWVVGRGERALLWPELLRKEKVGGRKKELGGIPGGGSHTEENKQACPCCLQAR